MLSVTKYLLLPLLLTVLMHVNAVSQKTDNQNIEHITLATDRNLYISGEPIWYSVSYSISDDANLILSKVLYVELFKNNQVVASQKVGIENNIITGRITIPEHVPTGYYILRAYTRYQENFPAWQFTTVVISVVNPTSPLPQVPLPDKKDQINIALMADGNIAFRIKNPITQKVKSVELLVNNKLVPELPSYYSVGIGSFNHNVKPNDNLSLKIMLKSGDSILSDPYTVNSSEIEIVINCEPEELEITLKMNSVGDQQLEISILNLKSKNTVSNKVTLKDYSAFAKIPIKNIGRGILLISIKDSEGDNIAQSVCFVAPESKNQISVMPESNVLPGDAVSVDLTEIDKSDYPLVVSMVMKNTYAGDQETLLNYLIDNPLYLTDFLSINQLISKSTIDQARISVAINKESLLDLLNDKSNIENFIVPEISGLTLQGKLITPSDNNPVQDKLVYSSILGNEPQFHASSSSADGSFLIPINFCYNQQDIYLATNNTDKEEIEIRIDNGFCPTPPPWNTSYFIPDTSSRELITSMYLNYQVNNTFNVERVQTKNIPVFNRPIFGDNLTQIKLSDYIQLSTTPEVFNELVPNVRVRKKDDHFEFVVFDDFINIKYDNPLVLVDNIPYSNLDKLMELQPTEIEQIDVSSHEYVYGNNLLKGIIKITTSTGNFAGLPLPKDGVFVELETLKPEVSFTTFSSLNNTTEKPNFTNTCFWDAISYETKIKQIDIIVPSNIADYELYVISLANQSKIISRKRIRVSKKPLNH